MAWLLAAGAAWTEGPDGIVLVRWSDQAGRYRLGIAGNVEDHLHDWRPACPVALLPHDVKSAGRDCGYALLSRQQLVNVQIPLDVVVLVAVVIAADREPAKPDLRVLGRRSKLKVDIVRAQQNR